MGGLKVNPGDLIAVADAYAELSRRLPHRTARTVEEIQNVLATHGTMGYPVAVGIARATAPAASEVEALSGEFADYSQRFDDSAGQYVAEDRVAAVSFKTAPPDDVVGDQDGTDGEDGEDGEDDRDDDRRPDAPVQGPAAPMTDPSVSRWDGAPPAGQSDGTGFWGVDMSRPAPTPDPLPAPAPHRSRPPCADLTGPSSGVVTVGGDSPQQPDAVGFDLQHTYRFRISGSEFTGQTQMVHIDGKWYQAQWHSYTYEMNRIPVVSGAGQIPALQLPIMSEANTWTPVNLGQVMVESSTHPGATLYLPDPFGVPVKVEDGGLLVNRPVVPIMTSGR
ncbi:hypothetical protein H7J77_01555 [Mycolicibacillus parakoreensis]|uniref:Type VII secretion target n=1 Tax=Mycolicibacillus parakoreensis TaxID=1069221 RepID=A0ABY3TZ22_9MYCO|nr:type VII secretion target [Mycolicibacillus parakoreensis]MCV7314236.1 hypothetical protein [Mycolicibacillus parakoreensis]ULN52949.1 type VII secretion target [Mycolicibacillus parakoreensis]HLR99564.1 type VII secretion target [Mycolicibacillus parakoreensis]